MTFETFNQSDGGTWPDQQKDNEKDKGKDKDNYKDNLVTCDIWDTDYNSDNWEPEFMTTFVTWQSRVTLDSIRNSCDFFYYQSNIIAPRFGWEILVNKL